MKSSAIESFALVVFLIFCSEVGAIKKTEVEALGEVNFLTPLKSFTSDYENWDLKDQTAVIANQRPLEGLSDEDNVVFFADHNLHLWFKIDKERKEAMVGTGADYTMANAIAYPPYEDDWWNQHTNLWESITIPSNITYNDQIYTVTSIAPYAFYKCTEIVNVSLPETINYIGQHAFHYSVNLENINIPEQVKSIEEGTFIFCCKLKDVTLPDKIQSIGYAAFSDCEGLEKINIPGSCKSIGNEAFKWCKSLKTLTIEDGWIPLACGYNYEVGMNYYYQTEDKIDIKPHYRGQFSDSPLDNLYLGRDLTFPTEYNIYVNQGWKVCLPFEKCSDYTFDYRAYTYSGPSLTNLRFGDNITEIADSLFYNSTIRNLGEFPNSLKKIGKYAFYKTDRVYTPTFRDTIVIPNSVESIGEYAFYNNGIHELFLSSSLREISPFTFALNKLKSISVPGNIKDIGRSAFMKNNIESVEIQEGVEYLYETCFSQNNIRDVVFPSSIRQIIGFNYASLGYVECKSLTPPEGLNYYTVIHVPAGTGPLYRQNSTSIIIDPDDEVVSINVKTPGSLYSRLLAQGYQLNNICRLKLRGTLNNDDLDILNGMQNLYDFDLSGLDMTELPENLFRNRSLLVSIKFPQTLTRIRNNEFSNKYNLIGKIIIPASCKLVGDSAFYNTSIDSVYFEGATMIGKKAFLDCYRLKGLSLYSNAIVGDSAYYSTGIEYLTIPSGSSIGNYAFSELKKVVIEDGVNRLGDQSLGLSPDSIFIQGRIKQLDCNLSANNGIFVPNIMTWLDLPDPPSNSHDADKLFVNGEIISDLVLPEGLKRIRKSAFYSCSSLSSVLLPEGLTCIGDSAFHKCMNLQTVTLPETLDSIQSYAFSACSKLSDIILPSQLEYLGGYALAGSAIKEIILPTAIKDIEKGTFSGCRELANVKISTAISQIKENAFGGCSSLSTLDLPVNITAIYEGAFSDCSNLKRVVAHWEEPILLPLGTFTNLSDDCALFLPINKATTYSKAGWNIFPNLKEKGIISITSIGKGQVLYDEYSISESTETCFFSPYKSFILRLKADEDYKLMKVVLDQQNITKEVNNSELLIEEPETNMSLYVYFGDINISMGDVNGDGEINVNDITKTAQYILKSNPKDFYDFWADMNDDGIINITDVLLIISEHLNNK